MKRVTVEFFGTSRQVIGKKEETFELADEATFRDLVRLLARKYPGLVGDVIQPNGEELQFPNVFNVNARQVVRDPDMRPKDGDRVLLMFITAGG